LKIPFRNVTNHHAQSVSCSKQKAAICQNRLSFHIYVSFYNTIAPTTIAPARAAPPAACSIVAADEVVAAGAAVDEAVDEAVPELEEEDADPEGASLAGPAEIPVPFLQVLVETVSVVKVISAQLYNPLG